MQGSPERSRWLQYRGTARESEELQRIPRESYEHSRALTGGIKARKRSAQGRVERENKNLLELTQGWEYTCS